LIIGLVLLMAVFAACDDGEPVENLELPTTPVLSFRAGWAVVDTTYARIFEQPDPTSSIVGHVRKSAVLEIVSKTNYSEQIDDEIDFWYQVRSESFSGWVFGTSVELYNSRERARNAARVLQDE
jgi:hypothetical protein